MPNDNPDIQQVRDELGAYTRKHVAEVRPWVYDTPELAQFTRPMAKVKGKYPTFQSVTGRVVQGFQPVWTPLGKTTIKPNELQSFHQKVNFPIRPANVLNSWLAENMYRENQRLPDMPISQYIMERELKPKVVADINWLSGKGVRDDSRLNEFGFSMNGLDHILKQGRQNGDMYRIELEPLTASNCKDQMEKFDELIPHTVEGNINRIFTSEKWVRMIRKSDRFEHGKDTDYEKHPYGTYIIYDSGRPVIGLKCLNGTDHIFATPDENFLRLFDEYDQNPAITDLQIVDYDIKVFMEWHLGYGFWSNQMVMVADYGQSGSGLITDNELYYPE